jgi:hypothetical protein
MLIKESEGGSCFLHCGNRSPLPLSRKNPARGSLAIIQVKDHCKRSEMVEDLKEMRSGKDSECSSKWW